MFSVNLQFFQNTQQIYIAGKLYLPYNCGKQHNNPIQKQRTLPYQTKNTWNKEKKKYETKWTYLGIVTPTGTFKKAHTNQQQEKLCLNYGDTHILNMYCEKSNLKKPPTKHLWRYNKHNTRPNFLQTNLTKRHATRPNLARRQLCQPTLPRHQH
jgi:hypothetical protein